MLNDTDLKNLDNYIDSLQANVGLRSTSRWQGTQPAEHGSLEVAMLQVAAQLNSMRPGANRAAPGFVYHLRERMLVEAVSSHHSSDPEC